MAGERGSVDKWSPVYSIAARQHGIAVLGYQPHSSVSVDQTGVSGVRGVGVYITPRQVSRTGRMDTIYTTGP